MLVGVPVDGRERLVLGVQLAGEPAATTLTGWNCAFQASLGLDPCSNTESP